MCGITGKRHGLAAEVAIDKKYSQYTSCPEKLVTTVRQSKTIGSGKEDALVLIKKGHPVLDSSKHKSSFIMDKDDSEKRLMVLRPALFEELKPLLVAEDKATNKGQWYQRK